MTITKVVNFTLVVQKKRGRLSQFLADAWKFLTGGAYE